MTNAFDKIGDGLRSRINNSAYIVVVWAAFVVLLGVGVSRTWYDFWTSYQGVAVLPVNMPGGWLNDLVFKGGIALLPQALTVAMGYGFLSFDSDDEPVHWLRLGALVLSLSMIVVDTYTGMIYYMDPALGDSSWFASILLAFGLDTLGSEFILAISLGTVMELWPDAKREFTKRFGPGSGSGGGKTMRHNKRNDPPQVDQRILDELRKGGRK